jgi:hypothetical protein
VYNGVNVAAQWVSWYGESMPQNRNHRDKAKNGQQVNDIICALDNPIEPSAIRRNDPFSGYRRRIKRTYAAEKHCAR